MKIKKEIKKKKSNDFINFILFMCLLVLFIISLPLITKMFYQVEHENRLNKIQTDYLEDKYRVELMKSIQPSNLDECVRGCEIVAKILMDGSTFGWGNFNSYKCYEYCLKDKVNTE